MKQQIDSPDLLMKPPVSQLSINFESLEMEIVYNNVWFQNKKCVKALKQSWARTSVTHCFILNPLFVCAEEKTCLTVQNLRTKLYTLRDKTLQSNPALFFNTLDQIFLNTHVKEPFSTSAPCLPVFWTREDSW